MILEDIASEEIINVRYSDIDFDKSLKMSSLLNFFQDIASDNAEKYGFGYSYIHPKNIMWVLLKYRIEFNTYPADVQQLTLKTEPRGCHRLFAFRNFELSSSGNLLARASSTWALVNFKTMEIENCETVFENNHYMKKPEPKESDLKYSKVPPMTNVDYEEEFKVRYNDIDVNMHANNANYVIWAFEPLPLDFRANHSLKALDIVYKKEIKYSEALISQVQILENNTTLHVLKNKKSNEDLCLFRCEWV